MNQLQRIFFLVFVVFFCPVFVGHVPEIESLSLKSLFTVYLVQVNLVMTQVSMVDILLAAVPNQKIIIVLDSDFCSDTSRKSCMDILG